MSLRFSSLSAGVLVLLVGVVACSGGSGGSGGPPPVSSPTATPVSKSTATPAPGSSGTPATATPVGATPTPHPGTTSTPTPKPGATATPTPVPTAVPSGAFNDYSTFGYDNQRDVFNPNSAAITDASVQNLHLAWQSSLGGGDYNTQTQPVLATEIPGHKGVLFVGGGSGNVYGYDATSGNLMWTTPTGSETYVCESGYSDAYFGVGGTVAYDPGSQSLYVVGNQNSSANAPGTNSLYHLAGANGAVLGSVDFAPAIAGWPSLNFSHTSVTLSNGVAYVGTGATCDISSWIGRVAAVNVSSMSLANTFYTAWYPSANQPWGGGGVWGWGGVSIDFNNNVLTGVGNTDDGETSHGSINAPFTPSPTEYSGYGDAFVQISSDLTRVVGSHHPVTAANLTGGDSVDLDLNGTPVVVRPKEGVACHAVAALQGKSGALYLYDTTAISNGPIVSYQLSPSTYADGFLGDPAYSPVTGLLYVAVPSSNESLYPPGMIAIDPGCDSPSVAWHSAFGPDSYGSGSDTTPGQARSVPAVSAGGVVFVGTICNASGNTCGATPSSSLRGSDRTHRPLICCEPPGNTGGALWALDASTGTVLNGGNPLIFTSGQIRVPPTIDGNWIFVLDNNGNMYGLTIDPSYPSISTKFRAPNARQRARWSFVGPRSK